MKRLTVYFMLKGFILFVWWEKQFIRKHSLLCYNILRQNVISSHLVVYIYGWHMYTHTPNGKGWWWVCVFFALSLFFRVCKSSLQTTQLLMTLLTWIELFGFSSLKCGWTAAALNPIHTVGQRKMKKASSSKAISSIGEYHFHHWCAVFVVASTTEDATVWNKIAQIKHHKIFYNTIISNPLYVLLPWKFHCASEKWIQ